MIDLSKCGCTTVLQRTGFAKQFRKLLARSNYPGFFQIPSRTRYRHLISDIRCHPEDDELSFTVNTVSYLETSPPHQSRPESFT